ncbi:Non-specific serine/threonine protein kinase [Mycena venus]|uniref:Non-specific serine/threonine protein kinase n=1 Tax=Mycena venus TaxID=2733690 RepID=A0A8H7DCZ5_9AGAR|nr:Non-specific serine/threonine protein kinase [Mycena venus]
MLSVDALVHSTASPRVTVLNPWTVSSPPAMQYQGWVQSAIFLYADFIDLSINPRKYYLDLQEIAEGPGGTTLYVARLADSRCDDLTLPVHVKERDRHAAFVAIKSVPILPSGSEKFNEVFHELSIMRDLRCENILHMDALYVDPVEDTLWIRMEFMTRSLSSIIELRRVGLALSDRIIAGCTKDIISALEYLRVHDIAPKSVRAGNVLVNNHGVLKLTNLSTAVKLSTSSFPGTEVSHMPTVPYPNIAGNATSLCLLVCDMATGHRLPLLAPETPDEGPPSSPTFQQFMQVYFDLEDWSPLSSMASRTPAFREFIKMCFEPAVAITGYQPLIESSFIRDACERSTLAQLLAQCTAFEARLREQHVPR